MNLTDLASFVRVVELGTITAAAEQEGVPKSTISRRIARLEQDLGIELLRRSPRSFVLTDDGKTLHARSRGPLQELEDVERALTERGSEPHGRLVISATPDLGRTEAFAELLSHFQRLYPNVVLEIRLEVRVVDLLNEGVDVAFRMHRGSIPGGDGLMSRAVSMGVAAFYASPSYLKRRNAPTSLSELAQHQWIAHAALASKPIQVVSSEQSESFTFPEGKYQIDDFVLIQTLLESGAGVGFLPKFLADRSVEQGKLVQLMPEWSTPSGMLSLVWPESRHLAPRIRAFVDATVEHLEKSFGEKHAR